MTSDPVLGWGSSFLAMAGAAYMFATAAVTADVVVGFILLTYAILRALSLTMKAHE
jgi:hypothetical protein